MGVYPVENLLEISGGRLGVIGIAHVSRYMPDYYFSPRFADITSFIERPVDTHRRVLLDQIISETLPA
ncbi:MAG: hypothetical protein ACI9Y1_003355 [Lentisphaeria bacterium]|jgi:hypothetical protein